MDTLLKTKFNEFVGSLDHQSPDRQHFLYYSATPAPPPWFLRNTCVSCFGASLTHETSFPDEMLQNQGLPLSSRTEVKIFSATETLPFGVTKRQ